MALFLYECGINARRVINVGILKIEVLGRSRVWGGNSCLEKVGWKVSREKTTREDLGVNGVIFKWIFGKQGVRVWT